MIRVKVGKDDDGTDGNKSQTFEIHKGILRYYSGYFRTAVDNIEAGRFKESEEGLISLPDEEPSMFRNFKDWMYARSFRDARSASGLLSFLTCIKVWCFADRCDVPSLQNEIMDYLWLRTLTSDELPAAAVRYAWDNTLPDSALRRYLMQFIVCIRPELADKHHHEWSAELLWDLLVATRMQPMPIGKVSTSCQAVWTWELLTKFRRNL